MDFFFLSRNCRSYGGAYCLTSYLPKASPKGEVIMSWWYWGSEQDLTLNLSREDAEKLEAKGGRKLEFGEALNLTTGEVFNVENAPRLERG